MFVIPVSSSEEHKNILAHAKELMEYKNGQVAIHPRFNKLITALRTAVENGEGALDKEATSHDDHCASPTQHHIPSDSFRRITLEFSTAKLHYFLGPSTTSAWLLRGMLVDQESP